MIESAPDDLTRSQLLEKQASLEIGYELFLLNQRFSNFRANQSDRRPPRLEGVEAAWARFRTQERLTPQDSRGGVLSLDPKTERIVSSTPRIKVFGLE